MRIHHAPYLALVLVVLFFGLLLWWDSPALYTQTVPTLPYQLTNQHVGLISGAPTGFTELNGVVYFGLASKKRGLWQSDGTAQGTTLVKDIQLLPTSLQRVGDRLYFAVYEDDMTLSLWQSDGTAAGTLPLKRELSLNYGTEFAVIGNTFYFAASDAAHGLELWKSDGTAAGTQLVADLNPGAASSYPGQLTVNNNLLYLVSYDEQYRPHLWQSDGTTAGTQTIMNTNILYPRSLVAMQGVLYFASIGELWRYTPGSAAPTLVANPGIQISLAKALTVVGNRLFFAADDRQHGVELWQSDGTTAGTTLVKDLAPDSANAYPEKLTTVGNLLYFQATDGMVGAELWQSDGTATGTVLVKDLNPGAASAYPSGLTAMNGQLYFLARTDSATNQLWKSDGTANGTLAVADVPIDYYYLIPLTAIGNKLYFSGFDELHGDELWSSDGTTAGTGFVKDLDAGHRGADVIESAQVGNRFYFITAALNPFGSYEQRKLWMSAGRDAPAILLDDQLAFFQLYALDDQTLLLHRYDGTGPALYRHEGGSAAPTLVKGFGRARLTNQIVLQGYLFFHVSAETPDPARPTSLWRTDGTTDGTVELLTSTATTPVPLPRLVFKGQIIAASSDELWVFDEAPTGPTHFKPQGLQGAIRAMVSTTGALYFVEGRLGDTFVEINTLWRSDGTPQGTHPLNVEPAITYIPTLIPVGNGLYLVTHRSTGSSELWYTDGAAGTLKRLLALTPSNYYANFSWITVVNNQLFFVADDGVHGPELWRSNGTPEGTIMLKDIIPQTLANIATAYPGPLFEFGDLLYFGANDGVRGQELWRSDGTSAGTTLFQEINPTIGGSAPDNFIGSAGLFFFAANDGRLGRELWQSNGTASGTRLVADLYPGSPSADPIGRAVFSDTLIFTADNGIDGQQLFDLRTGVPLALPGEQEPLPLAPHHLYLPITKQ
jgi:ELWxxDGT repeat protein